jgi:hypothetical protein
VLKVLLSADGGGVCAVFMMMLLITKVAGRERRLLGWPGKGSAGSYFIVPT